MIPRAKERSVTKVTERSFFAKQKMEKTNPPP
jgi:hypothetical protein